MEIKGLHSFCKIEGCIMRFSAAEWGGKGSS
jgi:hypothetical protein